MLSLLTFLSRDLLRNRSVLAFAATMLLLTVGLWWLEPAPERLTLNLVNVTLLFVPLNAVIFTITYYHNARDFTELLIVLPVPRRAVLLAQVGAVLLALSGAFALGLGLPLLVLAPGPQTVALIGAGLALTWVFVALAFTVVLLVPEKVKAMGWGLALWFTLAILYDGLLLALVFLLSEYPIEAYVVPVACLNPLDLARILLLLQFDTAALLGYTGAVYQQFFGRGLGQLITAVLLAVWVVVPLGLAVRRFNRMDL